MGRHAAVVLLSARVRVSVRLVSQRSGLLVGWPELGSPLDDQLPASLLGVLFGLSLSPMMAATVCGVLVVMTARQVIWCVSCL